MKKNIFFFGSILLAVLLLYVLLRRMSPIDIKNSFQGIRWRLSIAAFFLYTAVNVLRGYRFHVMLGRRMNIRSMVGIAFLHNFFTNLLPFRTGEISYLYLLRRNGFRYGGEGVASLVAGRIFDVFVLSNLIVISCIIVLVPLAVSASGKIFILVATGVMILFSFFSLFFIEGTIRLLQYLVLAVRLDRFRIGVFLDEKVDEARRVFLLVKSRAIFPQLLLVSFLIWIIGFWVDGLLLNAAGITFSFWQIVFSFVFPVILSEISPIQSFGNFGIYEWSLTGGLLLLGVSQNAAAVASVLVHTQGFLFALLLGCAGATTLFVFRITSGCANAEGIYNNSR